MNQMGALHAGGVEMAVFTEVYEEQRQRRLTLMDANPESR